MAQSKAKHAVAVAAVAVITAFVLLAWFSPLLPDRIARPVDAVADAGTVAWAILAVSFFVLFGIAVVVATGRSLVNGEAATIVRALTASAKANPRRVSRSFVRGAVIVAALSATLPVLAWGVVVILPHPIYPVIRTLVFTACVLLIAATLRAGMFGRTVALAALALIFNPAIPLHMGHAAWLIADAVAFVLLLVTLPAPMTEERDSDLALDVLDTPARR